jgi:hypothetical protein
MRRTGCARSSGNQALIGRRARFGSRLQPPDPNPADRPCAIAQRLEKRRDLELDLGHVRSTVRRIKKRLHFELE